MLFVTKFSPFIATGWLVTVVHTAEERLVAHSKMKPEALVVQITPLQTQTPPTAPLHEAIKRSIDQHTDPLRIDAKANPIRHSVEQSPS